MRTFKCILQALFRTLAVAFLLTCIIPAAGLCVAASPRVVVDIAGQFSNDPLAIRFNGMPGVFPMPSLLGGTFSGYFQYELGQIGVVEPNNVGREFKLSTVMVDVYDNAGQIVHKIQDAPNKFKYIYGTAIFALGPSARGQDGHAPLTPTDIRFELQNDIFVKENPQAPTAAILNESVLESVIYISPFIELDSSTNIFYGWDLPIVELTLVAREVPEPNCAVLFAIGSLSIMHRRLI